MDQGAGQAMEAACLLLVIGAGNQNLIALDSNIHQRMKFGMQGTLGALNGDGVLSRVDLDFHTGGNDDGFSSNSRHCLYPFLTTQRRELHRRREQRGLPCRS